MAFRLLLRFPRSFLVLIALNLSVNLLLDIIERGAYSPTLNWLDCVVLCRLISSLPLASSCPPFPNLAAPRRHLRRLSYPHIALRIRKSIFQKTEPCDGALVAQVTCISPRASLRLYCGYTPSDIIACSCPYGRGVWVSMGVRLSILSVDKRTGKNDQKIVDGDGTTRLLSSSTHSPPTLNRGEANYTDERTHFFTAKTAVA